MSSLVQRPILLICGQPQSGITSVESCLGSMITMGEYIKGYRVWTRNINDTSVFNEKLKKIIVVADVNQPALEVIADVNQIITRLQQRGLSNLPILILINKVDLIIQKLFDQEVQFVWSKSQFATQRNSLKELTTMIHDQLGWQQTMNYFLKTKQVQFRLFMAKPNPHILYEAHAKGLLYPIMDFDDLRQWVNHMDSHKDLSPKLSINNDIGDFYRSHMKLPDLSVLNDRQSGFEWIRKRNQHENPQGDLNGDG